MSYSIQKEKKFALIGIAASITMMVADIVLLGQPVSGSYYDTASFGAVQHTGPIRALIGSSLGLVASFFICFGYWYLKKMFEVVDAKKSVVLFVALCSTMFFGGAFHAGYYFLSPAITGSVGQSIHQNFIIHLLIITALTIPGLMTGNFLFTRLSMHKQFPPWLKFCNPLTLNVFFLVLYYFIPAPVGGYLKPTFVNMATTTLFIACLLANE